MVDSPPLFAEVRLSGDLELTLRRMNPWWEGGRGPLLPPTRRHLVAQIERRLEQRLAPIVVVRGPRQIGKTTAQLQVLEDLLAEGVPATHILRVQCDELPTLSKLQEPILRIVDWFERVILGARLNDVAHRGQRTYLAFDEVQNLSDWAPQLKTLVDTSTTQVLVTGSSALRIELGRDSLAGRIATINAGVLSLTEIAALRGIDVGSPFLHDNGLEPLTRKEFWADLMAVGRQRARGRDEAFRHFAERGGYPLVHNRADVPWENLANQLNEVVRRVIEHDLRLGERGRKRDAALLEEVFRLACRYAGQSPTLQFLVHEITRSLSANVGSNRVRQYLRFLADTLLVRLVEPLEIRLKKTRGSPKICLADHGLRASWLQERVPLLGEQLVKSEQDATLAGRIAESIVGASLFTISGLPLAHFPERKGEPEVDFILNVGAWRIPLEVKYRRSINRQQDLAGLRSFVHNDANHAPFGLLITQQDEFVEDDVVAMPLSSFLLLR